jgi:hypothetical protein
MANSSFGLELRGFFTGRKKMNAAPQFLLFSRFLFRIGGGEGVAPLAPTIAFIVLAGYSTYTVET